jgi:hypothetical protein
MNESILRIVEKYEKDMAELDGVEFERRWGRRLYQIAQDFKHHQTWSSNKVT